MNGRFLLDTSVVVALLRGDPAVKQRINTAEEVFISSVVLGELYLGARLSSRSAENTAQIESFATAARVISCDPGTAHHYASIKLHLRAKGRPLPENDIWIAATAQQHRLTLASRDAHFQEVDDLAVTAW